MLGLGLLRDLPLVAALPPVLPPAPCWLSFPPVSRYSFHWPGHTLNQASQIIYLKTTPLPSFHEKKSPKPKALKKSQPFQEVPFSDPA